MPRLARKVVEAEEDPFARLEAAREKLLRQGVDVIWMSLGQPSIPPPPEVREWLAEKLVEGDMKFFGYAPTKGLMELREAIVEDIEFFGGPKLDPDQVVVTASGQQAIVVTLSCILEPGDTVVVTDPLFPVFWLVLRHLGVKVVTVPERPEEGYQPDPSKIAEALEKTKAKAVILVTPDNPTGRVIKESTAKEVAKLVQEYDAWLIVDEAYRTLVYEGSHVWLYKYAPSNTIAINTFSKDPGIPGWRLGYLYADHEVVKALQKMSELLIYCAPSAAQHLAAYYLKNKEVRLKHLEYVKRVYKSKRDVAVKAVRDYLPKAKFHKPEGAMYIFVDLSEYLKPLGMPSEEFAERLLLEKHVAVMPGTSFGPASSYSIRLTFVTETHERIEEGVRRIGEMLDELERRERGK